MNLTAWRAWRRTHYADGEPRTDDGLGWLMYDMLATRSGAIAVKRAEIRYAKLERPQHTPQHPANAWAAHTAYARRRRKARA